MEIDFELDPDMEKPHFHDKLEVMYVLSGRIAVMANGINYVLSSEEFCVFNPFEHHEMYKEEGTHVLSAYISYDLLRDCEVGRVYCVSCLMPEQDDYLSLLRTKLAILYKNYQENRQGRKVHILSQLYGFLAALKHFETGGVPGRELPHNSMLPIFLYVNNHYMENISLKSTAEKLFLSKSYLSREFLKQSGMRFSEYLRNLRLGRAARLLEMTEKNVTEIAMDCGFANVDTMISCFNRAYGMTPGAWRRQVPRQEQQRADRQENVSYVRLLKYAASEENFQPLNKRDAVPVVRDIHLKGKRGRVKTECIDAVGIGTLKQIFKENVYQAAVEAASGIGIQYLFFHGILDDCMDVYHENLDGTPWFSYLYVDMALDRIVSAHLRPWIEIGYTPSKLLAEITNFYGTSHVELPDDLSKWELLVENLLRHLVERYGEEQVRQWRFSVTSVLFEAYGLFSMEAYLEYYDCTWGCVRRELPGASFYAATFDIGLLQADGDKLLGDFILHCREKQCMPDAVSFQTFAGNYSLKERKEVEDAILTEDWAREPMPPDENPDSLKGGIALVRRLLDENGLEDVPVIIDTWNSTMWQKELGNDTCFKAACIVKNVLENMNHAEKLVYSQLIDLQEYEAGMFAGGGGLVTKWNVPKSAYYAFAILSGLERELVEQGEGYAVTCSEDGRRVTIIFYNYCHYNMAVHRNKALPVAEQLTIDRYYGFEDAGVKSFQLHLHGLGEGVYRSESIMISREHGSSYDRWLEIGAPREMTDGVVDYLRKTSLPEYRYGKAKIDEKGVLLVSAVLDAHEVRMIRIYSE